MPTETLYASDARDIHKYAKDLYKHSIELLKMQKSHSKYEIEDILQCLDIIKNITNYSIMQLNGSNKNYYLKEVF